MTFSVLVPRRPAFFSDAYDLYTIHSVSQSNAIRAKFVAASTAHNLRLTYWRNVTESGVFSELCETFFAFCHCLHCCFGSLFARSVSLLYFSLRVCISSLISLMRAYSHDANLARLVCLCVFVQMLPVSTTKTDVC